MTKSEKPPKKGTPWSDEAKARAAATRAANAAAKKQAEASIGTNGSAMYTYVRHMANDVIKGIKEGEITIKNLCRRDALALLAYVELHSR